MKVIATEYQQERVVIDSIDSFTASLTASVLNEIEARKFYERTQAQRQWRFYSSKPDEYELRGNSGA